MEALAKPNGGQLGSDFDDTRPRPLAHVAYTWFTKKTEYSRVLLKDSSPFVSLLGCGSGIVTLLICYGARQQTKFIRFISTSWRSFSSKSGLLACSDDPVLPVLWLKLGSNFCRTLTALYSCYRR